MEVPPNIRHAHIQITQNPSASVEFNDVCSEYGARDFPGALLKFLIHHMSLHASCDELADEVSRFNLNFGRVSVFHKVKVWIQDAQGCTEADDTLDVVHARRWSKTRSGRKHPTRFDTVLINISSDGEFGEWDVQGWSYPSNDLA